MKKSWIIRKDEKAVSPVIATILMVAITVVLAAVLYVMVTGLLTGGTARPTVSMTAETPGSTFYTVDVADSQPTETLASFKAALFVNNTEVDRISPLANDNTGILRFSDRDGGGRLTGGDRFTIYQVTGGNTVYELVLFWKDGSRVVAKTWTI